MFNTLKLQYEMDEKQNDSEALAREYRIIITEHLAQVPSSHHGGAQKIVFARNAVIKFYWATESLSRIYTQKMSFQLLHGELKAAHYIRKKKSWQDYRVMSDRVLAA